MKAATDPRAKTLPRIRVQSNFRTSSNSDGGNWRPAALVICTRHPDLDRIRAFATVIVGLVKCSSFFSPPFDEEIVKPTVGVTPNAALAAGLALAFSIAGLSKTVFGLGMLAIDILEAAAMAASSRLSSFSAGIGASAGTCASAGVSGRAALRCFVSLNHSTQPPQNATAVGVGPFLSDGFVGGQTRSSWRRYASASQATPS